MIESQGWELAQLAYDERQSRNGGVLLLFRRAAPAVPPAADDYDGYYQDVPSESYQAVPFGRHSHRRGAGHDAACPKWRAGFAGPQARHTCECPDRQ